jgi:DNA gyrase inhibitor GyrI
MPRLARWQSEADLSDEQFAPIARFADGPPPSLEIADGDKVREVVTFLAGALKAPRTGLEEGKIKLGAYRLALTGIPADALAHAVTVAIETLDWLPTPAEVLRLAQTYRHPHILAHERAKAMTLRRRQRLFEETLACIRDRKLLPEELAALDEHTAKCAQTQGFLIIRLDGTREYRTKASLAAHHADLDALRASLHQERDIRAKEASPGDLEGGGFGGIAAGIMAGMEVSDGPAG